jgi:hypothetical protein
VQAIQAQYGQLLQLEQQLAVQEQQDQGLAQYGDQLPPGLREQLAARAPLYNVARERLAVAKAHAELELQRSMLEGPARVVSEHGWHQQAQQELGPLYDRETLASYLAHYSDPAAMRAATNQYIDQAKRAQHGGRAARGADLMGGPGGAAGNDWAHLSETDLYKLSVEQSERKAARRH